MPHGEFCPWCNLKIADWFIEWSLEPQKTEVGAGRLAMDCPNRECRRPVFWSKRSVIKAPDNTVPAIRPIAGAERWAINPSQGYLDLVSFLTDPKDQDRAQFFRSGYWPQINV